MHTVSSGFIPVIVSHSYFIDLVFIKFKFIIVRG